MDYITFGRDSQAETVVKKSRFIARCTAVESEEEARAAIADAQYVFRDARHVCFAYRLRKGIKRLSDSGEPQGTAGAPIMSVLEGRGIEDALITVTRYFGGILLGRGGLVEAYSGAAALAADEAGIKKLVECVKFGVELDYSALEPAKKLLASCGGVLLGADYAGHVTLECALPGDSAAFMKGAADLTRGSAIFSERGNMFLDETALPAGQK